MKSLHSAVYEAFGIENHFHTINHTLTWNEEVAVQKEIELIDGKKDISDNEAYRR